MKIIKGCSKISSVYSKIKVILLFLIFVIFHCLLFFFHLGCSSTCNEPSRCLDHNQGTLADAWRDWCSSNKGTYFGSQCWSANAFFASGVRPR